MELFVTLTRGMSEPTYGLLLSCRVLAGPCSAHPVMKVLRWILGAVLRRLSLGKYIILCASRGQRALNGGVLLLVMAYLT